MSNWQKLSKKIGSTGVASRKRKSTDTQSEPFQRKNAKTIDPKALSDNASIMAMLDDRAARLPAHVRDRYVGVDCEMVGIGPSGKRSVLARACVTSLTGEVLYDAFVRPSDYVTDFRTEWSGVRKSDMRAGKAVSLAEVWAYLSW